MASHVWDRKPTRSKADGLEKGYEYSISQGSTNEQAEVFAGYLIETFTQHGIRSETDTEKLYAGVVRNKWRLMQAKNAKFYQLAYNRHHMFFFGRLVDFFWETLRQDDLDYVARMSHGSEVLRVYEQSPDYDAFVKLFQDTFTDSYFTQGE